MYYYTSLVPMPLPVFQCYTLKNGKAWDATSQHIRHEIMIVGGTVRAFRILYDATHVRTTTVPRVLSRQDRGTDVGAPSKIQDDLNVKN